MIPSGDLRARWTTLAVAALCAIAWLGNAAHVAVAPHGHHDVGFAHDHDLRFVHDHEVTELAERSAPAGEGHRDLGPSRHPYDHDADDHRLAEAVQVQPSHQVALPVPEVAAGLVVTPRTCCAMRPPARNDDPPDPAPPSGALRLRAPPVG